jgi:Tol biopolymer transport system component/subtilisin family serine protease
MNNRDTTNSYQMDTQTKLIFITFFCLCIVCSGAQAVLQQYHNPAPAAENITNLPKQIIVIYKPEITRNSYNQVSSTASKRVAALNVTKLPLKSIEGMELVTLPENISIESAIGIYLNDSNVLAAEPNFVPRHLNIIPNDPSYSSQWAFQNTGQQVNGVYGTSGADISAQDAWDLTTGSNTVIIAVEDSGVDYTHADLVNNIWTDPSDPTVHGWNYYENSKNVMDTEGHGTFCAGIIGAAGNNGLGVTGTNWNVKIMPLKSDNAAGTIVNLTATVLGWEYAKQHGATIISNSWELNGNYSTIRLGIQNNPDLLFVFAAGNGGTDDIGDNNDQIPNYPSSYSYSNIVAVAASDQNDNLPSWSNYGITSVDLAAPGVNIRSTYLGGSGYGIGDGTSFSAPMVAGVAALIKARGPTLTPTQIKNAILNNVDTKSSFSNKVVSGGRLNAFKAIQSISIPDTRPTVTSITPAFGANTGSVSITNLAGTNFASGAIIRLTRSGSANITATGVTVVSPTRITCTLPLSGTTEGQYKVVVRNLDGKEGVLTNGFTIGPELDGDGIAIFRPSTGYWYFDYNLNGAVDNSFRFGSSTDQIITGDWQGTGTDGIAIFRPSTGYWYFDYNLDGTVDKSFRFGSSADRISKGDWNNDQKDDIAIFRPSTGYWYFDYNLDGTIDNSFRYGSSTDRTIVGKFVTNSVGTGHSIAPLGAPDGSKIAFESNRSGNYNIYVMNADGTGQTPITTNTADERDPAWSPDGSKIAYASNMEGNYNIYVMNTDGSGQTVLTSNTGTDQSPSWSPDGSKIIYSSISSLTTNFNIYIMNADGTGKTVLTTLTSDETWPSWSPDGTKIAFSSAREGEFEVYVMNADGTHQTQLTFHNPSDSYTSTSAWSPDGTKIAFGSNMEGNYNIYVMNPDGTGQNRLTTNTGHNIYPAWSRNNYLTVTSITPAFGANTGSVSITNLAGTNFASGAIVRLTRNGFTNITATGVTVVSPTRITCTLPLTGTTEGQYNVVVRNLDGKEGVLTNGFTIGPEPPEGGDGIAIFRPSTGYWYFDYNLDGTVDKSFRYGSSTDQIITGDWQGTGTDGIAIFRPSTGYWYFDYNLDGTVDKSFRFGSSTDRISKGDWNNDTKDDIAIFRPSTGYWYFDYNLDGVIDNSFRYGSSTDRILAGTWV